MSIERSIEYLTSTVRELLKLPREAEWVEFKHNNEDPEAIGEYISALSNSAALLGKTHGYLLWGVDNDSQEIIGTSFEPHAARVKQQELESWLLCLLAPKLNFRFYAFEVEAKPVVLLEVAAAFRHPVQFKNIEYIRVGSYKKKLKDYTEKERELWRVFDHTPFEQQIAANSVSADEVLQLLDYTTYFELLDLPLPEGREGILQALVAEQLIIDAHGGKWDINNLGAILFAKNLADFKSLKRKAVRVILYDGVNKVKTVREKEGSKGYACGFEGLIGFITNLLPSNEVIGKALRKEVPMFPELAIRELVANALIHQNFEITGTSPMIEIFTDRMEITNPGTPLVKPDRFLDSPPKSRNEALASFMRRVGVCEERGSGIDKVVFQTEFYQLPAPIFETTEEHTRSVLFAHKELKDMDKEARVRACYLHACLKHVQRDPMTNNSLRERFALDAKNSAMVSRIIKDATAAKLVRLVDETVGHKARKYIPWWA